MYSSKAVAVSTVGYFCIAVTGWMVSMTYADWFSKQYGLGLLFPLAIVLGVIGILSFVQGRALDTIVFLSGTALLGSVYAYNATPNLIRMDDPRTFLGWFAFVWAVFFAYVWLGSLRSGTSRMLFLLGTWLTLLGLAIGGWTGVRGWVVLAGYLGLITSIIAAVTSGIEIVRLGIARDPNLPVVESPRAMAAD